MNLDLYLTKELFWFGLVFAFVFGITIGSFLNVVIYRVPNNININFPPSHCPKCKHRLGPLDLFPLFSYLFLGRKCRYCGDPISPRYFTVELITGLLFSLIFIIFGYSWTCVVYALFASCLICVFLIDFDTYTIPFSLIIFGVALGIVKDIINIISASQFEVGGMDPYMHIRIPFTDCEFPMLPSVCGIVVCFLIFVAITLFGRFLFRRDAMGGGDTLLACVIGAVLSNTDYGVLIPVISFAVAVFLGAIIGSIENLIRRKNNDENAKEGQIPFGPYRVLGAFISLFFIDFILKGWNRYYIS
ncbi:MAG: prepilin peptidase, partial [Armatimonadetes bacterium]|nr:prepilin peptidase [Candidatus Hippobium faecium]